MNIQLPCTLRKATLCGAGLLPVLCSGALTWTSLDATITGKSNEKALVATYHFKNTGVVPVTIIGVKPSCGCTTTELAKETYAPGEEGLLKASLVPSIAAGPQEKTIEVLTDDSSGNPVVLKLHASVAQLLTLSSEALFWNGTEGPMEKACLVSAGTALKITALEVNEAQPAAAVATRVEVVKAGTRYRVVVQPSALARAGRSVISCTVRFADDTTQHFTLYALVK
jgi:hypothetical protein